MASGIITGARHVRVIRGIRHVRPLHELRDHVASPALILVGKTEKKFSDGIESTLHVVDSRAPTSLRK